MEIVLIVRRATLYEIPTLMLLLRRAIAEMRAAGNLQWDDDYPSSQVLVRDIELHQLWVADFEISEDENLIAGFAAITTDQAPEYAQAGCDVLEKAIVVHRLAIDPDLRGLGIANALMEEAEALAFEAGITVLRVDTNVENAAAQKLFVKLGYTLAGEISLSARPGLRFFCYEKRLPSEHS